MYQTPFFIFLLLIKSKNQFKWILYFPYLGGFDGTSNVLAGKLFGIPVKGTHAHAYVTSFTGRCNHIK